MSLIYCYFYGYIQQPLQGYNSLIYYLTLTVQKHYKFLIMKNFINSVKILGLSLLMISGSTSQLFCQKHISGIINDYGSVTSIGPDYATVDDSARFSHFSSGDTVMLIQMKGVRTYVLENGLYGMLEGYYGAPGQHEFLVIKSTDAGSNKITFRNNILNSFSTEGALQLVRVPSYDYVIVDDTLTCQPWDSISKTGGVLAAIAGRSISLNADINLTGKGFIGGKPTLVTKGICAEDPKMYKYAYRAFTDSAGGKGEGPVSRGYMSSNNYPAIYPVSALGKGPNLTAGGGGDGKHSGGGGGSNYGGGGTGGREKAGCTITYPGGLGGLPLKGTYLALMIKSMFPGGGGGASTYIDGSIPTSGGNGGGLMILVCDTLIGNGHNILAEGATPSMPALSNAGAGGGGGGGTIALHLESYSADLIKSGITISVNGGKGGNKTGIFGEGGGGGGGLVATNDIAVPSNVLKKYSGGPVGTRSGTSTGTSGSMGESQTNFVPALNGFLFNFICSSGSGTRIDTTFSDLIPKQISGTLPVGGSGTYKYTWQKSYFTGGPWSDISGAISRNYIPVEPETNSFWVRRIITDEVTSLRDTSNLVNITVNMTTGSEKISFQKKITIYPNPASLEVSMNITDRNTGEIKILLFDINGTMVKSFMSEKSDEYFSCQMQLSCLPPAVYIVRAYINNIPVYSGRLIKAE